MGDFMIYMIKVSLIVAVLYSFYWLFLRNNSFHLTNRFVLLFIIPFSILCPLLEFENSFDTQLIISNLSLNEYTETINGSENNFTNKASKSLLTLVYFLPVLYLTGCFLLTIRFLKNFRKVVLLRYGSESLKEKKITLLFSGKIKAPFSFFKWIFLPKIYSDTFVYDSVIEHERVHSRQMHSLDIILSEAFCIIFWFNPFVFLLKRSLKATHEYIADAEVIKNGISYENYLKVLISAVEMSCLRGITNHFKSLTIKKRVEMITNNKSSKFRKLSYLMVIPLISILVMAFSVKNPAIPNSQSINNPSIKPLKDADIEKITSGWGMRKHPITKEMKMHEAVDFAANTGAPVIATADGKVTQVEFKEEGKGYGRMVVVQHSEEFSTLYSQLSGFKVKIGDIVKKGDIVGYVGESGLSTGPHLHYEVYKNGKRVNPELYW